ncbi:hypothetical protein ACOSQ4_017160 [Xanthoceras sorbifolium]
MESPDLPNHHHVSGSFNRMPRLTKKQQENRSQLISKNLNFNLPIKLDDNNYIYWKTQILPVIRAYDLEEFIFGSTRCPAKFVESIDEESGESIQTYNDDYLNWKKIDQLLVSWLMTTLSARILGQVTQCVTSCEVWNTVTSLFSQQSMARIMHLRSQLQSTKKGSMKINEYIVKMRGLTDALMAAGQVMTERDLVSYILGGLGLEFDPVVVTITSKKEDITLQDTQFLLMSYESRLEMANSTATLDLSQAAANVVNKGNKGEVSANYVRGGQFQNNNGGRSKGRRGGRGGRYFNQRLTCQLCGKPGHFSAICYHRFDQTFAGGFGKPQQYHQQSKMQGNFTNVQGNFAQQPEFPNSYSYAQNPGMAALIASSSTVADPSWYVDSGATNHITPDFNNLSFSNEYKGAERLAVGNGHTLPISHVGQNNEESFASRGVEGWPLSTHSSKG